MPTETSQITLARRRQSTPNRPSDSKREIFVNNHAFLDDAVLIYGVGFEEGNNQEHYDASGNCISRVDDSCSQSGELKVTESSLTRGEPMMDTNNHLSGLPDSPNNQREVGNMKSEHKRKVSFSLHSLSSMNNKFKKNMNHAVEHPPIRELNSFRKQVGLTVNDGKVQGFILALIVINAIMMGAATFPFVKDNPVISSKFELVDQIFLIIFTIESAMQLTYHGWTLFKDAWLVFDITIVALSWALVGMKVFRAFRIFRALRLIGRIEIMRNLIAAVISVIPGLTGIGMLLFLVFYIFAVMFTQLYKDISNEYPRQQQYFVGLPETLFTLFQMMTLDGWKTIYGQAYDEYWWSWILFISFICITAFVFANLIVAVICDAVHVLGDENVAGLIGYDEGEVTKDRARVKRNFELPSALDASAVYRLKEMEIQLDQIVRMRSELVLAMEFLANKSERFSADEDPGEQNGCVIQTSQSSILDGDARHACDNAHPTVGNEKSNGVIFPLQDKGSILDSIETSYKDTEQKKLRKQTISDHDEQFIENSCSIAEKPPVFNRLNDARKIMGKLVNDGKVQGFILALIVINAIMMGAATFPFVKDNPVISSKFELVDQIFLIIFTIESAMQLTYHGWKLFKDAWLVFDITIVALSWTLEGIKVARAFRIFRALRLIARIDVMRNLIAAVISVIPGLTGIGMLLFLVFYIFAVMFTQLYKDISNEYPRQQQYFVGLPETLFTLFQMMTLDGWKTIYGQAYDEYWWSWILFVAFIVVSAFIFVNLIIAVICDAVHVMSEGKVAGLTGCDEDEIRKIRCRDSLLSSPRSTDSASGHKLRELSMSVDEIVSIQNQMMVIIEKVERSISEQVRNLLPSTKQHMDV